MIIHKQGNKVATAKAPVSASASVSVRGKAAESIMSAIQILSTVAKDDTTARAAIADLGVVMLDLKK